MQPRKSAELIKLEAENEELQGKLREKWGEQKRMADTFHKMMVGEDDQIGLIESQRLLCKNVEAAIVASRQPGYFAFYNHPEHIKQIEEKSELSALARRIRDCEREIKQLQMEAERNEKQRKQLAAFNPPQINSLQQWFGTYGKPEKQQVPGFETVFKKNTKVYGGTKHHSAYKSLATTMKIGRVWR
eukprot:g4749.t1